MQLRLANWHTVQFALSHTQRYPAIFTFKHPATSGHCLTKLTQTDWPLKPSMLPTVHDIPHGSRWGWFIGQESKCILHGNIIPQINDIML